MPLQLRVVTAIRGKALKMAAPAVAPRFMSLMSSVETAQVDASASLKAASSTRNFGSCSEKGAEKDAFTCRLCT